MEFKVERPFNSEFEFEAGGGLIKVSLTDRMASTEWKDQLLGLHSVDASNHIMLKAYNPKPVYADITKLIFGDTDKEYIAVPQDAAFNKEKWVATNSKIEYDSIRFGTTNARARPIKTKPHSDKWRRGYLNEDELELIGMSLDEITEAAIEGSTDWDISFGRVDERIKQQEYDG